MSGIRSKDQFRLSNKITKKWFFMIFAILAMFGLISILFFKVDIDLWSSLVLGAIAIAIAVGTIGTNEELSIANKNTDDVNNKLASIITNIKLLENGVDLNNKKIDLLTELMKKSRCACSSGSDS